MAVPLIGPLIAGLGRLIGSRVGHWIISGALFAGITIVTQGALVEPLRDFVTQHMNAIPNEAVVWLGFLNFDRAVFVLLGAFATKAAMSFKLARKSAVPTGGA